MVEKSSSKILQVTNIAPSVTREQMKSLFSIIGRVDDVRLFPEYDNPTRPYTSKVCYVKFEDPTHVMVSLHLTNTVFVDRALIIVPHNDAKIPDEKTAMEVAAPPNATGGLLPPTNDWPSNVVNQVTGAGTGQVIHTVDPKLSSAGLPPYPPLPGNIDASKVEEIRRTVYVSNLDSTQVTSEMVLNFFSQVGEVKYVRMAGDESLATRGVYVEFTDQRTIPTVFAYNGAMFAGKPVQIVHSMHAIAKPMSKNQEAITKEIDEAMKKVSEAHSLIAAAVDPDDKRRSRSRSTGRRRRHRSRSRSHKRSRTKSPKIRSRSRNRSRSRRSPRRRRSRSKSKRRSRSRSRSRELKRREKERKSRRSRSPRKTSRPSKEKKKSKSRSVSKSPKRVKKSKSLSPPKLDKISDSPGAQPSTAENEANKSPEMPVSSPVLEKLKSKSPSPVVEKKSRSRSPVPKKKRSRSPRISSKSKSKTESESRKRRSTSRSRRSRSPVRRRSRSPRRNRRSRSPRRRSKSPRRRSPKRRSRSPSPRKHRKDKKKDKDRDRSRSRDRKRRKERDGKEEKPSAPVKRDYDEEEKGYDSSDQDKGKKEEGSLKGSPPGASPELSSSSLPPPLDNLQSVDMDMDSD